MIEQLDPHITPQLDHSALLVIDTQVDFVDGGAFPVPGTTQVIHSISRLIQAYRAAQLPIVHVIRLYDGDDVDLARRTLIANGAPILCEAREKVDVDQELISLRCLADAHRRLGDHAQARAFLDDLAEPAARGTYRLVQVDAATCWLSWPCWPLTTRTSVERIQTLLDRARQRGGEICIPAGAVAQA